MAMLNIDFNDYGVKNYMCDKCKNKKYFVMVGCKVRVVCVDSGNLYKVLKKCTCQFLNKTTVKEILKNTSGV